MKKISVLIFVLALLASNNAFAQKVVEFGLYAGTSVTSLSGASVFADAMTEALTTTVGEDFPISESPRTFLFNAGGFIQLNVKPWLALKGGAEYAPKGESFSGEVYLSTNLNMQSEVLEQSTVFRIGYIDFPISVQFSTRSKNNEEKAYCYLNLGVTPAMKLFSKMDMKTSLVEKGFNKSGVTSKVIESDFQSEELEDIKITDFGMFCSVGVNVKSFFLDLKYNRSINNIVDDGSDTVLKHNLFSLCFGVRF
jgi:hypothetical protein